jgi:hypothetical protein
MTDEKLDKGPEKDDTPAAEGDLEVRDEEADDVKGGMTKQEFVSDLANRSGGRER